MTAARHASVDPAAGHQHGIHFGPGQHVPKVLVAINTRTLRRRRPYFRQSLRAFLGNVAKPATTSICFFPAGFSDAGRAWLPMPIETHG